MKICHVISNNPENAGGSAGVVNNLRKHIPSGVEYKKYRHFGIIQSLLSSIKLIFRDYDVIHMHDEYGYFYSLLPRFLRKKILFTSHALWVDYFNVIKPFTPASRIKALIAKRMQERIIRNSDYIVAAAGHIKKTITGLYGVKQEKIGVIYNGVDTTKFRPRGRKSRKTAIWVGDNAELKGLSAAIGHARRHKMKLLVAGINGESTPDVEYLGKVQPEKMPEIYNRASVLLFFSKAEGHPLVPLEAMACGLDIIASRESNIEIIPQKKDGSYKISGKTARNIVRKYDWKNQAKKYLKAYDKAFQK